MSEHPINRRRFIRRAAGTVGIAATAGLVPRTALAGDKNGWVGPYRGELPDGTALFTGVIQAIAPTALTFESAEDITVVITRNTRMWRDGNVGVEAFREGDGVTAYGSWIDSSTFKSTRVEPTYFDFVGAVEALENGVIRTSGGLARTTSATEKVDANGQPRLLRDGDLSLGSYVSVLARRERDQIPFVAVQITPA
jgi:Domain of unknown function (DUF5666)